MITVEASKQDLQFSAGDNESKVKDTAALVSANDGVAEILNDFDAMEEDSQAVAGDYELRVEAMAALALSPANDGMSEILACLDAMVGDNTAVAEDDELTVGDMAALAENPTGFDGPKDLWLDGDDYNNRNHDSLVDDATIFCNDSPPLQVIPCMSSSSSTPSTPEAVKPSTTTSSSSTAGPSSPLVSRTMMNLESAPQQIENAAGNDGVNAAAASDIPPPSDHDSIDDIMENLQFLLDCNEIWDPFSTENQLASLEDQHATSAAAPPATAESNGFASFLQDNRELSEIFFEWWRRNKSHVSVEDVKSIKLKNSIILNATQRLGTNSEGKKKVLIFILEWAKRQHLHQKSLNPNPNPNFNCNPMSPDPIACCPPASPWLPTPIYSMAHQRVKGIPYPASAGCQRVGYIQSSWAIMPMMQAKSSRSPDNGNVMNPHSLTSKEARKKRIKIRREKKFKSNQHNQKRMSYVPEGVEDGGEDEDGSAGGGLNSIKEGHVAAEDVPNPLKQAASDRPEQQVWKNMMLLMKKVLKQSDVGSLGRIVLPKKEAESYLPKLETKDWITIPIEDIGNSRVWNMRYRYWPNNKSRMYLLENTGGFVKLNGLQEGDFIFLYRDTIRGKYMIRGVKVPEPEKKPVIKKPVIKKPRKKNVRESSFDGNSSSHAPNKKTKI